MPQFLFFKRKGILKKQNKFAAKFHSEIASTWRHFVFTKKEINTKIWKKVSHPEKGLSCQSSCQSVVTPRVLFVLLSLFTCSICRQCVHARKWQRLNFFFWVQLPIRFFFCSFKHTKTIPGFFFLIQIFQTVQSPPILCLLNRAWVLPFCLCLRIIEFLFFLFGHTFSLFTHVYPPHTNV